MSKLFFVLLFLTAVGAGVLWWLIQSTPNLPHNNQKESVESKAPEATETHEPTKAHEAPVEGTEAPTSEASLKMKLLIQSEPAEASVFVDGHEVGKTPFELELATEPQKIELKLAGYEDFSRNAPALAEVSGGESEDLAWKIQMKPVTVPDLKVEKPKAKSKKLNKVKGDVFIQVRSLSVAESPEVLIQEETAKYLKSLKDYSIQKCLVNLGPKGEWARLIVGPYKTKTDAARDLKKIRQVSGEPEAFVTVLPMCGVH